MHYLHNQGLPSCYRVEMEINLADNQFVNIISSLNVTTD